MQPPTNSVNVDHHTRTHSPRQVNKKLCPQWTLWVALAILSHPAPAQALDPWQTVLDYQFAAGQDSYGHAIAADASGDVFSAGNGNDASGIVHGITLKTDTTLGPWYFSNDTNPDPTQYNSYIWDFGIDAGQNLYSIGQLTPNSTGIAYWNVRKSSDSGLHWSNAGDPYQYATGQWIDATGFAADDSGNIYVAGWSRAQTIVGSGKHTTTQTTIHWLVRKSADGGQTWTLVDDVTGASAAGAGFVPGAGVFVVGAPYASSSSWMVRRSLDAGATWSTVGSPFAGAAKAVGSDSQGNIYVVGSQSITITTKTQPLTTSSYSVWVTRKSSDGGNTWQTVDALTYAPNQTSAAIGIGHDSAGNVVVVGGASDAQGKRHWIVRTPDSSAVWHTIDDFQSGNTAEAIGVVTDAAGNLLVTGAAQDANGFHWIVRKLTP
jgi:hypothetical protein